MDWIGVKDRKNIQNIPDAFGWFHDSCLKELYMSTESYVDEELSMAVPSGLDTNVRIFFKGSFVILLPLNYYSRGLPSFTSY